jgi:hypothetical protein
MVPAQKQIRRAMKQNRRPQNKNTTKDIWSLTKEPKTHFGEEIASSTNGAGKTVCLYAEDWN